MFYDENLINNCLKCKLCLKRLDKPNILPCGNVICTFCELSINMSNNTFKCSLCHISHQFPPNGFPVCEQLMEILSIKPNEIQANNYLKLKQTKLNHLLKNSDPFRQRQSDGILRIKEYCTNLKNKIQTSSYLAINQINLFRKDLNDKVDQYELDTIKMFESKPEIKENYINTLAETDQLIKQLDLTENDLADTNNINDLLLKEKSKLDLLVFSDNYLKFDTNNQQKLSSLVLGSLTL